MIQEKTDFSEFKLRLIQFYAYRAFVSEGVVYPIITIFALSQGLSFADIGVATGTYFLGMLVGEIPTGYLGDRIGRRNGLVLGALSQSVVHLGFAFSDSAIAFVTFYGIWGVAATFRSGSADAWLYDLLKERNATDSYTRIRGRGMSMYYGSAAITALFGGVLYTIQPALPFLVAATMTALAAIIVGTLPESTQGRTETFDLADFRESLERILTNNDLAAFTFISGVLMSIPTTVDVFIQPISQTVGFTAGTLGPLYAGLMVTASAGSFLAPQVRSTFGIGRWFLFSPLVLVVALSATIPIHTIAIPIFFYSRLFNTTTATLGSTFLNDRIETTGRATTLSGVSMVYGLLYFVARSAGGAIAGETSPFISITMVGGICLVLAFLCSRIHYPFHSTE
ncbi:MFS transporter [Natronorubrum sp. FCH18a]|uniref:MFS transporter n=1 Tax=Natronorubrum sp. FCH18a TaxID=3447018 RepID=UPI003F511AF8